MAENQDDLARFMPFQPATAENDEFEVEAPSTLSTRRVVDDVRGLRHGILYSMEGSVSSVEVWLDRYCDGGWSLEIEDMDKGDKRKTLKIRFELQSDKLKFMGSVSGQ